MADRVFQFGHQIEVSIPENRKAQIKEALTKFHTGQKTVDNPPGKLVNAISNANGDYKVNVTITVHSDGQLRLKLS